MSKSRAERLMRRAIELSLRGFPAPNPRVGCVIAKGETVVGEGFHDHAGGPHAEVAALQEARENAVGADVFVTLEPCNHHGRTPPCSTALIEAGVRCVSYAVADPNPRARGGAEALANAGIAVESGLLAEQAAEVNRVFLKAMHLGRPFVNLKAAITLDGMIAMSDGESKWITGTEARLVAHRLRAEMGAVLVGANTVLKDDPELTARIEGVVNQPVRIVLDPDGSVPPDSKILKSHGSAIRLVGAPQLDFESGALHRAVGSSSDRTPNAQGQRAPCPSSSPFSPTGFRFPVPPKSSPSADPPLPVSPKPPPSSGNPLLLSPYPLPLNDKGRFDLNQVLDTLWSEGITSVLVEGGGNTIGGFLAAELYDRLDLFIAPKVFGAGISWAGNSLLAGNRQDLNLRLVRQELLGQDLHLTFE